MPVVKEAIILAGGFGTRLQRVVSEVPKPMAPVNGKPFLDYVFSYLRHFGVSHVVLSVGYLADKLTAHYGEAFEGLRLSYARETTPLGTGGGMRLAMQQCHEEHVLVLNGDSFFDVDLEGFARQYGDSKADGVLALRKVTDAARYGTICTGAGHRITAFREKDGLAQPGTINGGVYILKRDVFLNNTPPDAVFSVEKDFFETRLSDLRLCGFEYEGYFIDIGIPEDYQKAQDDFKEFTYR